MAPASPCAPYEGRPLDTGQAEQAKTGLRSPELSSPDNTDDGHPSYSVDPLSTDPVLSLTRLAKARLERLAPHLEDARFASKSQQCCSRSQRNLIHRIQYDRSHKLSTCLALNLAQRRFHGRTHELMDVRENSRRWTAYAQVVFKCEIKEENLILHPSSSRMVNRSLPQTALPFNKQWP